MSVLATELAICVALGVLGVVRLDRRHQLATFVDSENGSVYA